VAGPPGPVSRGQRSGPGYQGERDGGRIGARVGRARHADPPPEGIRGAAAADGDGADAGASRGVIDRVSRW
jgi:hypothetical protein